MVKPMAVAGAMVCWGVLFVGCAPAVEPTPSPEPSPVPTFQCTPEAGGEAYACDQAEYEAMVVRDEQYAEAERVYRRAMEIVNALTNSKQPINSELIAITTGSAQADFEKALLDISQDGAEYSGTPEIEWIRRAPDAVDQGSVVALEVCTSPGDQVVVVDGVPIPSSTAFERVFFRLEDGQMKMASGQAGEVASCWQ
ncbi:hypothetical protein PCC79_11390 [Propioniciclava soli]|uniref:Lipoprotein n=1 Tax=Propioniciclava soli TaxID=2775081 RepID=A0ABZ3C3V8_9ACTN